MMKRLTNIQLTEEVINICERMQGNFNPTDALSILGSALAMCAEASVNDKQEFDSLMKMIHKALYDYKYPQFPDAPRHEVTLQ